MLQHRLYKLFFATCIIIVFTGMVSCKKENKAAPGIERLRAIAAAPNDSVLTIAGPGQTVVIQGSNLATTREVYFNGYPSPFNSALLSDNNIVVTIPADMPFAKLDQADLNKVKVVTAYGEVIFDFPIEPPPPVIMTASNEYAKAGERITLAGNNFFYVEKVVFPGDIEVATNIVTNDPGTTLEVTVPAGITQAGPLKVVNQYGIGTSLLRFNDFTTGVLCNFDNVNSLNNWANATIKNSTTEFPGANGNYAHLKFNDIPANDFVWYGGGRSLNIEQNLQWVPAANLSEPLENFAVKFEIYAKDSWKAGSLFFLRNYDWTYVARYEPWTTVADFKTDGWKTVVIPLTTFKTKANNTDGTGDPASTMTTLVGANGMGGINIYVINNSANPIPSFDIAVDNFRVIKIK